VIASKISAGNIITVGAINNVLAAEQQQQFCTATDRRARTSAQLGGSRGLGRVKRVGG